MRNLLLLLSIFFCQTAVNSQEISLMTYNVKYANENDGENSWSLRKDWITGQLQFYKPDILGVQEAVKSQLDHFTANIKSYKELGEGRDGGSRGEFSAIFYNKNKFRVVEQNTFWLSESPNKISRGWDAAFNRICTYALFEEKVTGRKFWIFNTHFDHLGEKARMESAKLIIQKITSINKKALPVFLMGDFNLEPETEGIGVMLDYLEDSMNVAEYKFGPAGTYNAYNFSEPVTRRIDYIFINDKVQVENYAVLSDSKDLKYPSDHLPVMIKANLLD